DRRAMGVVRADVDALIAAQLLETYPDVGLDVFKHVPQMDRTVGIGQGTGDEDLAGIGVAGHGTRLLLGDRSKPVIVPVWRGEVIRWAEGVAPRRYTRYRPGLRLS